jgi:hypothetical protein
VTESGHNLLPQHRKLIEESAISSEVAQERGYFSATKQAQLESLGFRPYQRSVPAMVVPIFNVHGEIALHQIRPDRPRVTDGGKELKYETPTGARLVVDVPPRARLDLGKPKVPLWITEGSRKADAAVSAGLCCIGLLGVYGWRGTNEDGGKTALSCWESIALNGREVFLCFDSDVMTKEPVNLALMRLKKFLEQRDAQVKLVYLPDGEHGEKVGLDDFLAAGHTVDDLVALTEKANARAETSGKKEESQAKKILSLVGESDIELFHDSEPRPYVTFTVGSHRETHALESRRIRRWLAYEYYRKHRSAPNPEAVNMARLTLEGRALFEGPQHEVHLRVARDRGGIVIDLCDNEWRVVRIDAAGWNVLTSSPVRFRRAGGMLPLPVPEQGGSFDELQQFVNVPSEDDFVLLIAWLVGAARNKGPYPVLGLHGEQGSAKSTTSRVLRRVIDPNKSEIRAEPREPRDLVIAANNGWVIALDNLSRIKPWLSDALCRLATGGGFSTRTLYTDAEETIFDAQRPILVNGIEELAVRGDLVDRSILVTLPRIKEQDYLTETRFWPEFEAAWPRLLGALLDALSTALRRENEVSLEQPSRMVDFATWVVAAEPALPWEPGRFVKAYSANRTSANEIALEASPVATELERFLAETSYWSGNYKDLLAELEKRASEAIKQLESWPKSPRGLSGELRRLAPNLRAAGIEIEFPGKVGRGDDRHRVVRIKVRAQPSPPSPPTDTSEKNGHKDTYEGVSGDGRGEAETNRPHDGPRATPRDHLGGDGGADGDRRLGDLEGHPDRGSNPQEEWETL